MKDSEILRERISLIDPGEEGVAGGLVPLEAAACRTRTSFPHRSWADLAAGAVVGGAGGTLGARGHC